MSQAMRRLLGVGVLVLASCGPEGTAEGEDRTGPWSLAPEPSLDIGVLEGEDAYQLHDVRDVTRLPGGHVAIAHQGTREVRIYDADGRFVVASGEDGDGPGQWRAISTVRHLAGDTLLVIDHRLRRYGFVDAVDGSYLGAADEARVAGLRRNRWHRAGLFLEAPPEVDDPTVLEAVVAALDVRDATAPVFVHLESDGRVWVLGAPSAPERALRLFDLDGVELAELPLPDRFQPMAVTPGEVLGIWRDSMDVQHVRAHALRGPGGWPGPTPGAVSDRAVHPDALTASTPDAELPELSMPFRNVAMAQEMGYAGLGSYTADAAELAELRDLELPASARLDILDASPSGWMGRIVDTESGSGCMLLYGAYPPIDGVTPGAFSCWEGT